MQHVVQLMGVCRSPPAVVMEFMERGTLFSVLHNDALPLPFDQRVRFGMDVGSGMRFLHSANVVHRDLKSHNVLLNADWRCKVGDLGQAIDGGFGTMTAVAGTWLWAAPVRGCGGGVV